MPDEMNKGDEEFVKIVHELAMEVDNYAQNFSSLCKNINESIIRFDALLHPTSEKKLKAISLPTMEEIGRKIKGNVSYARDKARSIKDLLKEVEDILKTSKIKCSFCDDKGEVIVPAYNREEGIVQSYMQIKKCSECNGKGYFAVSKTVVQLASQLTDGLKELTHNEISVKI